MRAWVGAVQGQFGAIDANGGTAESMYEVLVGPAGSKAVQITGSQVAQKGKQYTAAIATENFVQVRCRPSPHRRSPPVVNRLCGAGDTAAGLRPGAA
jgi:hypothetical protein